MNGCHPDWYYKDVALTTKTAWLELFDIIGHGNYKILVFSERVGPDGEQLCRGQIMVSPVGMNNAAKHILENPSEC